MLFILPPFPASLQALTQIEAGENSLNLYGGFAFLLWRSVYITKQVSFRNRVLILFDWIKTRVGDVAWGRWQGGLGGSKGRGQDCGASLSGVCKVGPAALLEDSSVNPCNMRQKLFY